MNTHGFPSPVVSTIHSYQVPPQSPVSEESTDFQQSTIQPVKQSEEAQAPNASATGREDNQQQVMKQKLAEIERREQQVIDQLAARDREVRNHERAHAAVGGQYASAPRYEYQRGPDGVSYAIGGEVSISTSPVNGNPQQTIEKAQIIKRAALAPAEPSAQDRKVAAEAVQMEAQARVELVVQQREARLEEQQQQEEDNSVTKQDEISVSNANGVDTEADPIEDNNKAQETVFNEINNDLAAQLVSLGGAQQAPKSLGSIISSSV